VAESCLLVSESPGLNSTNKYVSTANPIERIQTMAVTELEFLDRDAGAEK
jgi:hypothetical protein